LVARSVAMAASRPLIVNAFPGTAPDSLKPAASMFDLDRFKRAQERSADGFTAALGELQAGRKRTHWIWYVFPQLAGLGRSVMAARYALHGADEATAYLRDSVLRERLLAVVSAVVEQLQRQPAPALDDLMGSEIDALKLVSSMTLFREVADRLNQSEPLADLAELGAKADAILRVAAKQGFPECASTRRQLAS
jgi:uncharacterized protein (DUF1810 family)